jgi:hypothetical protein
MIPLCQGSSQSTIPFQAQLKTQPSDNAASRGRRICGGMRQCILINSNSMFWLRVIGASCRRTVGVGKPVDWL